MAGWLDRRMGGRWTDEGSGQEKSRGSRERVWALGRNSFGLESWLCLFLAVPPPAEVFSLSETQVHQWGIIITCTP